MSHMSPIGPIRGIAFRCPTAERSTANRKPLTPNRQLHPSVPLLPVIGTAVALSCVFPRLDLIARGQVFVDFVPAGVFLGSVIASGE
jgi:hypothetical protein